jgi:TonB-linked SusC/RagA family outer membrane protein
VTSEQGQPLDAEVLIEELSISVRSAREGHYRLVIPAARVRGQAVTLTARLIGYRHQSRLITLTGAAQTHDFTLRKDINQLEAVIVVGIGTPLAQKRLPFSATRIDAADLPVVSTNVLASLQGRVPGMHLVVPSGRPGTAPAIVMRGPKSINADDGTIGTNYCNCPLQRSDGGRSQEPLIIIDGAMVAGAQDINPDDVESYEIIKGAAATTMYGSRAGAGVIQITTKRAGYALQRVQFGIRTEYGFSDVQNEFPFAQRHFLVMDEGMQRFCIRTSGQPLCSRTVDFEEEAQRINDVYSPVALDPRVFERDYSIFLSPSRAELRSLFQVYQWPVSYNPVAQVFTNGATLSTSMDLSGRSGASAYYASLSDLVQEGAFRYLPGYRRSSARANVDEALGDASEVKAGMTWARGRQHHAVAGLGVGGRNVSVADDWFQTVTRQPAGVDLTRRDARGRLYIRSNPLQHGQANVNPLYTFENLNSHEDHDRFIGSLSGRHANSRISLDASVSADRRWGSELGYVDRDYRTVQEFGQPFGGSRGLIAETATSDLSANVMLSGRTGFSAGPDLKGAVIARYSAERFERRNQWARGEELAYSGLQTLANATAPVTAFSAQGTASAIGVIGGLQLEYRDRYIFDGLLRYDGSSLFGAAERWHPYYRASLAWRLSDEEFWPAPEAVNDLKLRASVGTAGGRPNMQAQYETFALGTGAVATARTLGNTHLKPEHTRETELGFDAELWHRVGLTLTHSRAVTTDQLLIVPAPVASGFSRQWQNAGTLDGQTWELSLRLPLIEAPHLTWNVQVGWDRHRTTITELNTLPFMQFFGDNAGNSFAFLIAPGERYGTIYGRRFATSCTELPAPFDAQCGPGNEWQPNNEGYIVWAGQGNSWRDGLTRNLWHAVRPGCLASNGSSIAVQGEVECRARGGTVNSPWGVSEMSWGMPIVLRDSTAAPRFLPLGNTMPDHRVTMSHDVRWRRLGFHVLLDMSVGNRVYNSDRRWSYGDFMTREQDQDGATVETAKPIGYYWRGFMPGAGIGGFYGDATASNRTVEDGSYTKLREFQVSYDLPRLSFLPGAWSIALIGRNAYTWTRYSGWDPEAGYVTPSENGSPNSAAITTGSLSTFPPARSFTVAVRGRM